MARRRQPRHNPLAKLKPYRRRLEVDMVRRLKRAQGEIKGRIALAAAKAGIAGSAREREALFREIEERYGELANGIDAQLKELTGKVGRAAHEGAVASIGRKGKSKLVNYDPERTERYFQMIHPMNGKNIAAVFTDQMSQRLINTLRSSYVDVFRQGVVEGMTANELHKALRDRWDKLAGDGNNFRFVDSRGRRWENARYFQMLVRTNAQRVERESSIDTFAREGLTLMRISDDGDADCDICAAWEGRIVQTVGESDKYPTYEEAVAAGVFHPNCTHTLEYVDELLEKDDIERQAELGKPDDTDDVEEMQAQKDEIDEGRYIDKGMSRLEAQRAVTADRLEKSIRGGIFSEEAGRAARMLSPEELDRIRASGIPMFEKARNNEQVGTKRHGRILTPREATAQDMLKLLGVSGDGGGKAQAVNTAPSSPLLSAINSVRPDIANKKHEVFVVFDQNGKEVFERHNSGPQGGRLPAHWMDHLSGKIMIHNHPVDTGHKGFGRSFSLPDIETSSSLNFASIAAVSPRRDYIMEPGDPEKGWPSTSLISRRYRKHEKEVIEQLKQRYRNKRISFETMDLLFQHMTWKRVAKETGIKYSVIRHKEE